MSIWNLGSINLDHIYRLAHLPRPGETVAAVQVVTGLGGKGANQSVAAARAGARVRHIGAVGPDGAAALRAMEAAGVDCGFVAQVTAATGHAVIALDAAAENMIIVHPGANRAFGPELLAALDGAAAGDTLLLQNETAHQPVAAQAAVARGMRVVYSAAPFAPAAVKAVLPFLTTLVLNEVEAAQLGKALGLAVEDLPVPELLVTRGAAGADWRGPEGLLHQPAFSVRALDTTGAGDCFAGYFAAARDEGTRADAALRLAAGAAALQVMGEGAADAMPLRADVEAFLAAAG